MVAKMVVGYRLRVRQDAPLRVVERTAEHIEVELPLETQSNATWSLTVDAPGVTDGDAISIQVLDAAGSWQSVDGSSAGTRLVRRGGPTHAQPVRLRLRVPPGTDLTQLDRLRFLLLPGETGE